MESLENFMEINRFLISNRIIFCKFNFNLKFTKKKEFFKSNKKNKNSVIRIPFWMGKILNLSSFCQVIIPSFLGQRCFKKFFAKNKIEFLEIFLKKFFFLAIKISRLFEKKIIDKILKVVFLEKFLNFKSEIKKVTKKNSKKEKFNLINDVFFSLSLNFLKIFFFL
jgi:hypothetical protein